MSIFDLIGAALGGHAVGGGGAVPLAPSSDVPVDPTGLIDPRGYTHPVRDAILQFLGGAAGRADSVLQNQDVLRYQNSVNQLQAQRMRQFYDSLPDDEQKAFLVDPQGVLSKHVERFGSPVMKQGETFARGGSGGAPYTAPTVGIDNGRAFTQTPDGMTVTGNTGPDLSFQAGAGVIDKRGLTGKGGLVTTIPQFQKLGPGETGGYQSPPMNVLDGGEAPAPAGASGSPSAMPGAQRGPSPAAFIGQDGKLDPAAFFQGFTLKAEGGLNPHDLNGSPTKYGFNQAANRDIDVHTLTPETAAQRFATNYYAPSGAGSMRADLGAVHADTYFLNPSVANRMLQQSQGDPGEYLILRDKWFRALAAKSPAAAKYLPAWLNRNAKLSEVVQQMGEHFLGADADQSGAPDAAQGAQPAASRTGAVTVPTIGGGSRQITIPGYAGASQRGLQPSAPYFDPDTEKYLQRGADGIIHDVGPSPVNLEGRQKYASTFTGTKQYQDYDQLTRFYHTAQGALRQGGGPADLQLLDMALKANNPSLGIRPNQVDQMMDEIGLPNRFKGELQALVKNGQALSPQARQSMVNVVTNARTAAWQSLQPLLKKADRDAATYGLNRQDLVPDVEPLEAPPPDRSGFGTARTQLPQRAPPTVGAVEQGYQYVGGDPSQPSSWRKAN